MVIPVKEFLLAATLALSSTAFSYPPKPDNSKTQGHLCDTENRDFSEYRYVEHIPYCRRNVSEGLKRRVYESYGVPVDDRGNYTIDHLIPLSIGGDNSQANLWSEHRAVKATRQNTEMDLYLAVRSGKIQQREAVEFILRCKFLVDTCVVPD